MCAVAIYEFTHLLWEKIVSLISKDDVRSGFSYIFTSVGASYSVTGTAESWFLLLYV